MVQLMLQVSPACVCVCVSATVFTPLVQCLVLQTKAQQKRLSSVAGLKEKKKKTETEGG